MSSSTLEERKKEKELMWLIAGSGTPAEEREEERETEKLG
jgi:hypothetical protein